jgi:hypothetical protein
MAHAVLAVGLSNHILSVLVSGSSSKTYAEKITDMTALMFDMNL